MFFIISFLSSSFDLRLCVLFSTISMQSLAMVAASTTVGTPIEITFTPSVSSFKPSRLLFTPDPGFIPQSESWIVVLILSRLREASASTAITKSGFVCDTIPFIIFDVSIPVVPSTPGATAHTEEISSERKSAIRSFM